MLVELIELNVHMVYRILILDEATSCLDSSKEARVQRLLLELLHLTTIVTVAHRLANIMEYDRCWGK